VKRKADQEIYALKKVIVTKLNDREKENSINEIRILASINHPNVICYKEAFYDSSSSSICTVMEYADDGDLEIKINQKIKSKTHFNETEIWNILYQITNGIKTLHERKILHRDLKSANVFLFKSGQAKLGDLNVSKINKKGLLYTQTGTPYYASPEVWKNKPYDHKSDIWSLGCVIYEMTALKPPFRGNSMEQVYNKVIRGNYDQIPTNYSHVLTTMISSLIQVNPNSRPSCEQIINTIHNKKKINNTEKPNDLVDTTILLQTIKMPRNLIEINPNLPKSTYKKRYLFFILELLKKNPETNRWMLKVSLK
jgi:NIMA (never in mitosis gene a)-related kinase